MIVISFNSCFMCGKIVFLKFLLLKITSLNDICLVKDKVQEILGSISVTPGPNRSTGGHMGVNQGQLVSIGVNLGQCLLISGNTDPSCSM